jgi:hypothetical protein
MGLESLYQNEEWARCFLAGVKARRELRSDPDTSRPGARQKTALWVADLWPLLLRCSSVEDP